MRTAALLLPLLLSLALAARAAPLPASPDAGTPDAGLVPREVDVKRVDGGYALEAELPAAAPAAGAAAAPSLTPPELLVDSPAVYPESLRAQRLSAEVKLELLVDEQGDVVTVTVVDGDRPEFNEAAVHAATKLKFKPARLGDTPVQVRMFFSYRFEPPPAPPPQQEVVTGVLKGRVRAKGNRKPIPGAALYFVSVDKTVEADANGQFEIALPPGVSWAQVTAPGYKPGSFREEIKARETLEVIYGLEPLVVNPYETIVRGDRERTEVSRVTLHEAELREVPGTMGDPFRVVMLLPGVSSVASGLAYPVVRGSMPAATGYFIDGIRVPILFHLLLGPAVVHPDFIETIDFFPGAPPPQYGRLLGGAIDGKISRTRDDRIHGTVYADLINAGLFLEVPIEQTGTNLSLAGRYSYTPFIAGAIANAVANDPHSKAVFDFYDYQARIEQKVGPGTLRLFAFGSSDVLGVRAQDEEGTTALQSIIFHRLDLRYRQPLGAGEVEAGATVGEDLLRFQAGGSMTAGSFSLDEKTVKARAGWEARLAKDWRLQVGADFDHRQSDVVLSLTARQNPNDPSSPLITTDLKQPVAVGTFVGAWAQATWTGVPKLSLIPGLRVDNYHLVPGVDHPAIEPRLTARYGMTDVVTLKAGAGLYHQPPVTLLNLPAVDVGALRYGLQEALQTDVGVEWKVLNGIEVNADVYFNPVFRALELDPFQQLQVGPTPPDQDPAQAIDALIRKQITRGYAYGFELMIRHPLGGNWFGWLSYSFQHSVRRREIQRHDEHGQLLGIADTVELPFAYDQTHVLNAVLSYKLPDGWTVGGVLHFNTGRPEIGGLTSVTHVPGTDPFGQPSWVEVDLDKADRLPPFFRFDARVSKTWAFDLFSLEVYFDMLNVTLSQEVLSFNYQQVSTPANPTVHLEKTPVAIPLFLPILGVKARY